MLDIEKIISQLSLEEKAALCSGQDFWHLKGIPRLGISAKMITDGPHGLRKEAGGSGAALVESVPATCFPTASCLASTWNRDLIFQVGQAIAEECLEERVSVVLGPGANIKRSTLCGRNFEYFSEDPLLSGEMAKSWITGAQSRGVGASLKHYAVNNQEFRRMTIDAQVDERALREIYLASFEIAVRGAQPWTVMAAYNRLNGTYCCENRWLLNEVLRKDWGFKGLVMSDWGAVNDCVEGLRAGLDLEMPGVPNGNNEAIIQAVIDGRITQQELNCAVGRILRLIECTTDSTWENYQYDRDAHHLLARQAAVEGAVLLKNEDNLLPLAETMRVALIGAFAKNPRYQGSGSSLMNPSRLENLHAEMLHVVGTGKVSYTEGYDLTSERVDERLIAEAVSAAQAADVAVVCAGLPDRFEVEGIDRTSLALPASHDALILDVARANPRTVVVLSNGAPVEMPWIMEVRAVLEGYLGGQAGAGAITDLLYGRANPSGKLAETFPLRLADTPSFNTFPGGPETVEYRESVYVGYRFYDTVKKEVLFPFGHGLSYTQFEYSDLELDHDELMDDESLKVSLKVRNIGKKRGKEIVQLYVRDLAAAVFRPDRELKAFIKIALGPGEQKRVGFTLDQRAFAFYDPACRDWVVEEGEFEILVGASSRDIRLAVRVRMLTKDMTSFGVKFPTAYKHFPPDVRVTREDFECLLGYPLPGDSSPKKGSYTINTPINDMRDSLFGRWLACYMKKQIGNLIKGREETPTALMMKKMAEEAPLRVMLMSAEGKISRPMLDGLLAMANGKWFTGLSKLLGKRYKKEN